MLKKIVAVIDVGSNSIKLLVARKKAENGFIESVFKKTFETRISAGIGKENPVLTDEAINAGCQSIAELVHMARDFEPGIIKIVATSAVRDAGNGAVFAERVKHATGITLDILSGMEEATYIGSGLRSDPEISALEDLVQMDIGGGSLELIRFKQKEIREACSLKLGAVRLTEQFVADRSLAVSRVIIAKIEAHVRESIRVSGFDFGSTMNPMIVTGGAFSVISSILAAKETTQADKIVSVIFKKDIAKLKSKLCALTLEERKALPGMSESRADVMPVALITIDTALESAGRDRVTQSSCNLRYGVAAELLA